MENAGPLLLTSRARTFRHLTITSFCPWAPGYIQIAAYKYSIVSSFQYLACAAVHALKPFASLLSLILKVPIHDLLLLLLPLVISRLEILDCLLRLWQPGNSSLRFETSFVARTYSPSPVPILLDQKHTLSAINHGSSYPLARRSLSEVCSSTRGEKRGTLQHSN